MAATIVNESADSLTIQVVIPFNRSMLLAEDSIQNALNEAGTLASDNFLHRFDTDGSPIVIGQTTLTSQGTVPKEYQTPYGATIVERHVYQSSRVRPDFLSPGTGGTDCHQCHPTVRQATGAKLWRGQCHESNKRLEAQP